MALILRPERWLAKPPAGTPLDRSHPLAAGLRLFIPFTEGGGAARDVVTGRLAYVPVANGKWAARSRGIALTTVVAGESGNLAADPQWQVAAPMTVLAHAINHTQTFDNTTWWGAASATFNSGNCGYGVYSSTSDSTHHASFFAGTTFTDLSLGALVHDRPYQIAMTYDGATVKFYVEGVLKGSGAHTGAIVYAPTGFQFGQEGDSASGDNSVTDALSLGIWGRVLSGAELQQLAAAPYALLAPRAAAQRFFVVGAGGGSNALAGTGGIVTGGTASLAQTIALAGSGTIATAGTAALVQTQALAGTGAIVTGGSATLSTTGSNALSGSGPIVTGGTANLAQAQPLAGGGAIVTSGTAALAQAQALAGAGAIVAGGGATLTNTGGGSGTANFAIGVNNAGTGGNDFAPAAVRDSSNRLWRAAVTSGTTDFTNSGGQYNGNTLRMFRADQDQVPSSFTEKDSAHRPTNVGSFSLAIDGGDTIHIAFVHTYAAATTGIYYTTFNTTTNLWSGVETKIGTANYATTASYLPGDAGVSMALDAAGVPHVVAYGQTSGTGATHIFYTNKVGGTWSTAVQLDTASLGTNQRCMHPQCMFDSTGALHAAWMTITANYGTTLEHAYYIKRSSGGTWGGVTQFTDNLLGSLDNGPALYVSEDDHIHIAYGLGDGTNPSGQAVTGATVNNSVFYRVSSDGGATWVTTTQPPHYVSHDFSLGPDGRGGVRIYAHVQPTTVDGLGTAIGYMQLPKGGSWAAWTQIANDATGDGFDCTVSPRRETFFHNRPAYLDTAYTDANLPVSAMLSSDPTGNALVGQTETGAITTGGTATLTSSGANALAGTGAIVTSGTGALTQTQALAGIGAIVSGAAAALTQTQALSGSGPIVTGGTGNLAQAQPLAGAGAILTGGAAALTQTQALAGTGAIVSGGSAALTVSGNGALAGTGAIATGGAANLAQVQPLSGAGSIGTGGGAALSVLVTLGGTGAIVAGGAASLRQVQALGGAGAITTAGLALLRQTHALGGVGTIGTGGTATLSNGSLVTFGTVTLTDTAVTTIVLTDRAVTTITLTVTDEEGVAMNSYLLGNVARLNAEVKDSAGIDIDAGTALVSARPPSGTFAPVTPTHVGTGLYAYDYKAAVAGTHTIRAETTNPDAAAELSIYIEPSGVL